MVLELGMKGGATTTEVNDRLRYEPETYEFHLFRKDLYEGIDNLKDKIDMLYENGVTNIVLHHPMSGLDGNRCETYASREKEPQRYKEWYETTIILSNIVKEYRRKGKNMLALVHLCYGVTSKTYLEQGYTSEEAVESLKENILEILPIVEDTICFENSSVKDKTLCLRNKELQEFIKENNVPICLDVSHLYIATDGSNDILEDIMVKLKENIVHYHVVDSLGQIHDGLPLGEGTIDWKRIKPLFNDKATSIYEIALKDIKDSTEMYKAHCYIHKL